MAMTELCYQGEQSIFKGNLLVEQNYQQCVVRSELYHILN